MLASEQMIDFPNTAYLMQRPPAPYQMAHQVCCDGPHIEKIRKEKKRQQRGIQSIKLKKTLFTASLNLLASLAACASLSNRSHSRSDFMKHRWNWQVQYVICCRQCFWVWCTLSAPWWVCRNRELKLAVGEKDRHESCTACKYYWHHGSDQDSKWLHHHRGT